jgi:hypothetical protein
MIPPPVAGGALMMVMHSAQPSDALRGTAVANTRHLPLYGHGPVFRRGPQQVVG